MSRPDHEVTIALVVRAVTLEPDLLRRLLAAEALDLAMRRDGQKWIVLLRVFCTWASWNC